MTPSKEQILKSFDRASVTYEDVSFVQRHSADFLVKALVNFDPVFSPETILDLGAGTGYVCEQLIKYYPQAHYTLNDLSPRMLDRAQQRFSAYPDTRVQFHLGDMEALDPPPTSLIISNLALQWTHHFWKTLEKFYLKSRILAFCCLTQGTFLEWEHLLNSHQISSHHINSSQINSHQKAPSPLLSYPTCLEVKEFCHQLSPRRKRFWTQDFPVTFPDLRFFIHYLRQLGASSSTHPLSPSFLKTLISHQKGEITVTYKLFFGVLSA